MISIVKTTKKDSKDFYDKEWANADVEHYGKVGNWKAKTFRYKAISNGEIVGFLKFEYTNGVACIHSLIIAGKSRDLGIGGRLIEFAEEKIKELGAHKIWLITGKGWKSVEFYEKHGYKQAGNLENHYLNHDFIIFTKFLK
ncbi:MAG: GNAT family N-acetyltransferase [Candidatus Curtissbacteria bacterium]